jgi:hypothetical protein
MSDLDLNFKKAEIKYQANKLGLRLIFYNPKKELYQFYHVDQKCFIDVWARSLKVLTCMNRPPHGYSSLLRERVGLLELKLVFENPRIHLSKGRRLKD